MDLVKKFATPKYLGLTILVFMLLHAFIASGYHVTDIPNFISGKLHSPGFLITGGKDTCDKDRVVLCCDGSTVVTDRCIDGVYHSTGKTCPSCNNDNDNSTQCTSNTTETCSDSSIITTAVCIDGSLKYTNETCPQPECNENDTQHETCNDGSIIITKTCENGSWQDTGNTCSVVDNSNNTGGGSTTFSPETSNETNTTIINHPIGPSGDVTFYGEAIMSVLIVALLILGGL